MLIKDIKTGDQVQIVYKGSATQGPYLTRVEVVESDKTILIHAPLDKGKRIRLVERNVYGLRFISGEAQVNFDAKFMEHERVEGFEMLRFFLVSDGEKVQRRNAFRFICSIPVTFNVVADSGEQSTRTEGVVRDLSSGGIKMITTISIPQGSLLRIDLFLDDDYVMAFGHVLMTKHTPENVKYPYQYGIRFEVLPESDEERIVRYVYNEQRKLLKRPQKTLFRYGKR
ncbi:MAG: flagellar brake protein [Defluviitaleaceae bacterium]|nr:flagellar brake protein [Defluviitaleaceae bacterium]